MADDKLDSKSRDEPSSVRQVKVRFAEMLASRVCPALLAKGFVARRPNRKRVGGFPVNYSRVRGHEFDCIWFQWRSGVEPLIVIWVGQSPLPERLVGRNDWSEISRGGDDLLPGYPVYRVGSRKRLIGEPTWFGIGYFCALGMPRWLIEWRLSKQCGRMLVLVDQIDIFFKQKTAFPELYDLRSLNLPSRTPPV